MATPFALFTAGWALASALAVATLGLVSMRGGRARPRGALAFGLFSLAWGGQVAFGSLGTAISSPEIATVLYLAFLACMLPVAYFLVEFAASQSDARSRLWVGLRWSFAALALLSAFILILTPELLFLGVREQAHGLGSAIGPLFIPLVAVPQFAAFGLTLWALHRARRNAATPRIAQRARIMLAGIGVYVGFAAGNNLAFYAGAMTLYPSSQNAPYAIIFTLLSLVALAIAITTAREAFATRDPTHRKALAWVSAALIVPFAWGVVEAALALGPAPRLDTVGLWRLVAVAILAYGLARWRQHDLAERTARGAASAGGAAAAVVTGATAYGATTVVTSGSMAPVVVGLIVLGVTFFPGVKFALRLFDRARERASPPTDVGMYGQRLDAYRAALEASIARNSVDEDEPFLSALRERFMIDPSEHRVLLHYAKSSVILASDATVEGVFERLRLLGEGGAGRTWLARDRVNDKLVVLKEPLERWQRDARLREAVLREAQLTARVRHPNVVTIFQVLEDKGMPILVMEYVDGGSLADALRRRGALDWKEAIQFTVGMLRGVGAIHASGILHRDLKPSNVLLRTDGRPVVADFGIAVPSTTGKTVVEATTSIAGTLSYMAPEVRTGSLGNESSDIYACAAILHECLSGSPPGSGAPMPVDVPVAIQNVLSRALSPIPAKRPASAHAFAEELTGAASV